MDSLLEPVELNRETAQALDEIRSGAENALYGAASADAEEKVNNSVLPLIEGAGLPGLHVMHYRWYLRELARHWRTRRGRDLAFHLELCIRKWVGLGLEPRTLQFLICEAHQRLKGKAEVQSGNDECRTGAADAGLTTKTRRHEENPDHSATKTRNHEEEGTTAKDAKGSDSPTGILESTYPGTLPGIMAGPRPPADPTAASSPAPRPSPLTPAPEHSIPRSLDPSIPEELP